MIRPQFLNLANSSFLLFLEHYILEKGSGLSPSVSSNFYPIGRTFNNYYTYASPYQPQVANAAICQPATGIYINNVFVQRGQSGFVDYNYFKNWAYFSSNVGSSTISGTYPINDISILPLEVSEDVLLFETKFNLRKPNSLPITGLAQNTYTYPSIYVKTFNNGNEPFAFGGEQLSEINMGLFIMADSAYQLDAIKSILCDAKEQMVAFFSIDKFPYNALGGFKETGSNFNYNLLKTGYLAANSGMYISDITINTFNRQYNADFTKLNPDVYTAIADIKLCKTRYPRSTTNNL